MPDELRFALPDGLGEDRCRQLAGLLEEITGCSLRMSVPMIAPATVLGHADRIKADALTLPAKDLATLHEFQSFTRRQSFEADDGLEAVIGVESSDETRVLDTSLVARGQELASMQTRLRFVPPKKLAGIRGADFPDRFDGPDVQWSETREIESGDVRRYADLSGDHNPIHLDDATARAAGLKAAVVHGNLLAGLIEPVCGKLWPQSRIVDLKLRFMGTLETGSALRIGAVPKQVDDGGQPVAARCFLVSPGRQMVAIADLRLR